MLGIIGFISPLGEHFCQNCNRLRLTSDGRLRSWLVIPDEVTLHDAVRNGKALETFFGQAIVQKPEHHNMVIAMPAGSRGDHSLIETEASICAIGLCLGQNPRAVDSEVFL